jgi:hypothetical protein
MQRLKGGLSVKRVALIVALLFVVSAATGGALASPKRAADSCGSDGTGNYCAYVTNECWSGNQVRLSSKNYWHTNQAWRPSGVLFKIAWLSGGSAIVGAVSSTQNPLKITGSYGYDQGYLWNQNGPTCPVTARFYNYYLS